MPKDRTIPTKTIEMAPPSMVLETVAIDLLKDHPRNYRVHPPDEIEHLVESIREHGIYRNIVTARDHTILAGHGVRIGARAAGYKQVPIVRLDLDPFEPRALKVLAGDNEIGHLSEIDDRALSEILKEIKDFDPQGLMGTGYDEMMLANLVFVTRPQSEIADFDEAAEWVGMPEYELTDKPLKLIMNFRNAEDRADFAQRLGIPLTDKTRSAWWPPKERDDNASVLLDG